MRILVTRVPIGGGAPAPLSPSGAGRTGWLLALVVAGSVSVVLIPAQLLGPEQSGTVRSVALAVAVLGAWIGVLRIPAHRRTAACIAASSTLMALGDLSSGVLGAFDGTVAGLGASDLAFLLAYLLMWVGLRRLLPPDARGNRAARLDSAIDAGAVLVVMSYVEWELALATVGSEGLSPSVVTVWMLYPFLDAALLALTVRIWASRCTGDAGLALLAGGLFCWFAADLGHLLKAESPVLIGAWVDAGWLLASFLFAGGIWLLLRQPAGADGRPVTVARIGLALLPVLAPALGAVVAHRTGDHGDPVPGLLATVVLL
ncbi:MAG: hypothetical protein ACLGI3_05225, partial [Actinomycetes bacterium]